MGEELEWGKEGWMDAVRRLADPPPDLILAADCCYVDQVGLKGCALLGRLCLALAEKDSQGRWFPA